jgi:hypothetical protein
MKKVYIPQLPTRFDRATSTRIPCFNLNPASEYGELVTVTETHENLTDAIATVRGAAKKIESDDYILAIGNVILLAVMIAEALKYNSVITLLRWDRVREEYSKEEIWA